MRMRRKKNLEARLEECRNILFKVYSDDKNFSTAIENKSYFDYAEIFGNANPVHMEIGCGKGQFIC